MPLWSRARSDGLVAGSWSAARAALIEPAISSRATEAELRLAVQAMISQSLGSFVALVLLQLDAFYAAVLRTRAAALAAGWTPDRVRDAILALAEAWALGSVAETWLDSGIVRPHLQAGEQRGTTGDQGIPALFPYLEQRTRADDRVRENHDALHLFVARSEWSGWVDEAAPPLGWRCRCRDRRIDWLEAKERGLRGDFPVGTEQLAAFRALGGADADFPRDLFVVA